MEDILLIFDMDLTLIDSKNAIMVTFQQVLRDCHLPVLSKEEIFEMIGIPLRNMFRKVTSDENVLDSCIKTYRSYFDKNSVQRIKLFTGVKEKLSELKENGFKMTILTNRRTKTATIISNHLGIDHFFDMILGVGKGHGNKPDPEPIHYLMKKLKVKNAVLIGDHAIDARTAQNANIPFIAVLSNAGIDEDILKNLSVQNIVIKSIRYLSKELILSLLIED
ncbi:MAG: HAD family hydrolase [Candidatus Helarchaeota archaeon]